VLRNRIRDPGSGAFWPLDLDPGSWVSFFSGSRIPNPFSASLATIFWLKNAEALAQIFSRPVKILNNYNFLWNFIAAKKLKQLIFLPPVFCCLIRDPGWKKSQDPGSGIPDPQHWTWGHSYLNKFPKSRPVQLGVVKWLGVFHWFGRVALKQVRSRILQHNISVKKWKKLVKLRTLFMKIVSV